MSKSSKKIQKNIQKNKESKKEEYPLKNQIITLSKWIIAIMVTITIISVLTSVVKKEYTLNKEENNITNEILAGQTFNRVEEEYYVAFYEFDSKEDLTTNLSNITNTKIYKVNLTNAMNKDIVSETSNDKATTVEELQISGPTLIKINDNKITSYIEGYDDITTYLNELS